jgi:nitroreductase
VANIDALPLRKPADASYPIHELISERWSPRAFADRLVEREKLYSLLEAARWAASSGNLQPWYFVVGTKEHAENHARLVATLRERNILWAQHAPVLILVVAKLYDRPGKERTSFYDVGMAVGNLVTQAVDLGLVTHQMGGFDPDKACEALGIPEGHQPLAVIALGYPGAPDVLPDDLRKRELAPRSRKPLEEFVFEGHWEQSVRPL